MKKPTVEITIPVYNEEKELKANILALYLYCKKHLDNFDWHITIADNASSDNTPIISATIAKQYPRISFFRLEQKGRGRAVKRVWSQSKADFCIYMDLDLSTDLVHLPRLIHVLQNGYDIAVGSRLLPDSKVEGRTMLREITSRSLNMLIHFLFQTSFTDAQCGFKSVTKTVIDELLPKIKDNDWFFDGELLIIGEKSGYRLYEEPIHWVDNPGSTVRLLSTIYGDVKVMLRLFMTRPWKNG